MSVHDVAARGFGQAGDSYERGRPGYPEAAVALLVRALGIAESSVVLDLGAGTGKLTAQLAPSGARIVALEPVPGMREKLAARSLPRVSVVGGVAEAIPLATGTADAVLAGQAFHWFKGEQALAEIHRVLRPGGRLGLVWNRRDTRKAWVAALASIVDEHEGGVPRYVSGEWRRAFERTELFSPLRESRFEHAQAIPRTAMRDRVASTSFIAALPERERERLLRRVDDLLLEHAETRSGETLTLPYVAEVHCCERR
ncbi:class I SAM-dependent methyltransferase [bacterium]|nr:class I SAM-dependent methyltransferase [bacterium]